LENFLSYFIFRAFPEFSVFLQIPEFIQILYYILVIFSLLSLMRGSLDAVLIFNAEISFLSAFNALQINSNQVIMTFVFSVKRDLAFSLDAGFIFASGQLPDVSLS